MKDFKSLKKTIKNNRIFGECVAEKLGISLGELYRKLDFPMNFTLGELAVLKRTFHMSAGQAIYIFTPWVAFRN